MSASAPPSSIHIPRRSSSLRSAVSAGRPSRPSRFEPAARSLAPPQPAYTPTATGREGIHSHPPPARSSRRSSMPISAPSGTTTMKRRQSSASATAPWSCEPANTAAVKSWDGNGMAATGWDGLRRDSALWFPDGDCFVHLYEKGNSRRGPSFCVRMEDLQRANCGNLFTLCFAQKVPRSELPSSQLSSLRDPPDDMYELYMPAPEDSMREEAFQWHLTTRNFFAFIFKKGLVGAHLGSTLIQLQERLHLFRSTEESSNFEAFIAFVKEIGYLDFTHRPDNALAVLFYAEHYQLKSLWIDAYAHCVGMGKTLFMSPEHAPIPRVTKSLIMRAYLEMDLHLGRVSKALSNFLEDDLSPSYLGLPQGPRAHLERFRSFLHSFYVDKYGYWPPPKKTSFPKVLYRSMYFDFRSLYDFLVDLDSSDSIQSQKPADGGVCVLQNLQAFDKRHKYTPLPHPQPLIPTAPPPTSRIQSQKNLLALKLGHKQTKTDKQLLTRACLSAATNSKNPAIINSPLVKAYKRFEIGSATKQKEKVTLSDARKVRWILIYAILQMLTSVMRVPREVRDTDDASYPLCCLTAGTPPWKPTEQSQPRTMATGNDSGYASAELDNMLAQAAQKSLPPTPGELSYSIRPDCDDGSTVLKRRLSVSPTVEVPAPLRFSSGITSPSSPTSIKRGVTMPPLTRSFSWRSSFSHSLSPFASRRNSIRVAPQPSHEIQVPGYGNGLNETILGPPTPPATTPSSPTSGSPSIACSRRHAPPGKLTLYTAFPHANSFTPATEPIAEEKRTPTLESFQLDIDASLLPRRHGHSSALATSAAQTRASRHNVPYFHAHSTGAATMRRSNSSESASSALWSPTESTSSPATSVASGLSLPPSPAAHDTSEKDHALARTQQLMDQLDLETGACIEYNASISVAKQRPELDRMHDATAAASSSSPSPFGGSSSLSSSCCVGRPGTADKARRVMGLDTPVAGEQGCELVGVYQALVQEARAAT